MFNDSNLTGALSRYSARQNLIAPISSATPRKRRKFYWSAILTTGIRGLLQWPDNLTADGWPVLNLPADTTNTSSWWMASRCSTRMPRVRQSTRARNQYHWWPSAKHERLKPYLHLAAAPAKHRARQTNDRGPRRETKTI